MDNKTSKTNVEFELNTKLYDEMDEICEDLGMTVDDAFQIFARKMVNEQGIPFEVTEKEYPEDEKRENCLKLLRLGACIALIVTAVAGIFHCIRALRDRY